MIKRRFLLSRPTEQIVVVVDDDLEVREALMSLLHSAQFNAIAFSSAEDALRSGLLSRASCLISDLHMAGMQGLELQGLVKREYPELPVLLITGHREEMVENGSLYKGAAHLFYKPLHPEEFLNAIESAISDSPQSK